MFVLVFPQRKYPSFEMAAAPLHEEPDQRTRKATAAACGPGQGLSVLERLLMGLLKVEDLASKGIQLSEEEMNLYHRIKNGHSR